MRTRTLKLATVASLIAIAGSMAAGSTAHALSASAACPNGFAKVHDSSHSTITLSACEELFVDSAGAHTIVWTGGLVIVHGAGADTLDYSQAPDAVTGSIDAKLLKGKVEHKGHLAQVPNAKGRLVTQRIGAIGADQISGIANITGTPYDDVIIGDNNNNSLKGGAGNDFLDGRAGKDVLDGGAGRDHLVALGNDDMLYGGDGTDTCVDTGVGFGCADGGATWG